MKYVVIPLMLIMTLCSNSIWAQQTQKAEDQAQINEILEDSTLRSLMMEKLSTDPELRREMMSHLRENMRSDMGKMNRSGMRNKKSKMQNDPDMKKHMRMHMKMMKSMHSDSTMHGDHMNTMMEDSSMMQRSMKMHLMCMEMMQADSLKSKKMKRK